MKSSKEVNSLTRGLAVLDKLNVEGAARAGSIARGVRLARPADYRPLDTFEKSGFVAKSASDERCRITQRAAQLFKRCNAAAGGTTAELLQAAAVQTRWLLHLSTFDRNGMVVRLTGWPTVPVLPCRGYTGRSLPPLTSVSGHAYIAACDEIQTCELAASQQSVDELSALGRIRLEVSALGYATCTTSDPRISHLSVGISMQAGQEAL